MEDTTIINRIRGTRIKTGANRPFLMDDPGRVYLVERGHLDLFAVELDGDTPVGRKCFVARVPTEEMAFGCERLADPARPASVYSFLAVPALDTVIVEGDRDGVGSASFDLDATTWIDDWVSRLSRFLTQHRAPPRDALLLEADPDVSYPAGSTLSAQHLDVIWVSSNCTMRPRRTRRPDCRARRIAPSRNWSKPGLQSTGMPKYPQSTPLPRS